MRAPAIADLPGLLRADRHDPAFVGATGRTISRGDLADRVLAVAGELHRRGLTAGDTVALAIRPGPEAVAVLLAAQRLGVRVVAADPRVGPDVLTAALRRSGARMVLTEHAVRAAAGWASPALALAGLRLAPLDVVGAPVVLSRRLPRRWSPDVADPDADATVVFTSGTTGDPRAVVHTGRTMSAGAAAVAELTGVRRGDTALAPTIFAMLPALIAGARVCTRVDRRSIAALRPQFTYVTPPQARTLLARRTPLCGRVFTGSAPASASLLARLCAAGADDAWSVYALTEAFPVAAVSARDKLGFDGPGDLVGTPVGGMAVTVTARGEVTVSGPATCDRHLGSAPSEWIATGDRGEVVDGRLVLHGRLKDMILRDAVNIYPGLYEPSLHVPGVAEALLVGVPGHDLDERVVLVVEPDPGVDHRDVRRALRDPIARLGAARPDDVVVARIPRSARSRKPDRAATALLAAEAIR
jgi:acyl-CoA synthetase (AMP-forming)/AMP-acid ligase II